MKTRTRTHRRALAGIRTALTVVTRLRRAAPECYREVAP